MATGRGQFLLSLRQGLERTQPGKHGETPEEKTQKSPTREGDSSRRNRRRRRRRCKDERNKSPPLTPPVECCPTQPRSYPSQTQAQSGSYPSQPRSYPSQPRSYPSQPRSYPSQTRSYPSQTRSNPSQTRFYPSQTRSNPSQSRSTHSQSSFKSLPPEIILKIFSYLDAASLFSAGFVNRQFRELANDNAIWYELYACEMGRRQQRPSLCETPESESPAVQDVSAAMWKKLVFREMGWHRDMVWKKDLRHMNLNTGMPEQTEQVLRGLSVFWEITVTLKGRKQSVYKQSQAFFSDSSVTVCWSRGMWPKIHHVYSIQLYGVQGPSRPVSSKPPWRSLISKTLLSRSERWKCIGTDSLVKLIQFDEGITVGVWRGTWVIAFITATLHFHRLVERSMLGSLFCPYRPEELSPLHPDVPQGFGVQGYTVHLLLHNSVTRIMQRSFSPVLCTRDGYRHEYVQLHVLNSGMSEQHTPISGKISFPWSAGELQGDIKNCCVTTVSVLDAAQRPVWCISSSSSLILERSRALSETYDGEQFALRYSDSAGKLKMTLVWMQDLQLYFLISLNIWIRAEKVNTPLR